MKSKSDDYRYCLKKYAKEFGVLEISNILLDNPDFSLWSGSAKEEHHHYGDGGLIEHTYEVCEIAYNSNRICGLPVQQQKLFLACLYHDAGKLWDYKTQKKIVNRGGEFDIIWVPTEHKELVGHLSRSAIYWSEIAPKYVDSSLQNEVLHAILAHHGQREWGSPVTPKTPMAWLLHCADQMSARVNETSNK